MPATIEHVKRYISSLQDQICAALEQVDGEARFIADPWTRPASGAIEDAGGGDSRVLAGGRVFEKAGVNTTHIIGEELPASASARRPELAGCSFHALGISLVIHPLNPFVPTSHANLRFFIAEKDGAEPVWWFGGGYDLTPYYGFTDDCRHWHSVARDACQLAGDDAYAQHKQSCDDYFHIKHRHEQRGIGGVFFDDLDSGGFDAAFAFVQSLGDSFLPAYLPIVERRKDTPYNDAQRQFQLYRRGRYVEFNLVYDRGTLFGLQSDGRIESILMSLPPLVRWDYDWQAAPGSDEEKLTSYYLQPRDWLAVT